MRGVEEVGAEDRRGEEKSRSSRTRRGESTK